MSLVISQDSSINVLPADKIHLKMHTQIPSISVVIPSARTIAVLATVEALLKQEFEPGSVEIIVVSPHDCLPAGFLEQGVRLEQVDRLYSPGKMRNIGALKAQGQYLAFIDDDCVPPPDWLSITYEEIVKGEGVGAVGCRVIYGGEKILGYLADFVLFSAYQYDKKMKIELGSAALLVRKSAFFEVDGFDEVLLASEDWDFSLKLAEQNWISVFTPEVEVIHNHGRETVSAMLKNSFSSGFKSGLEVQRRHYHKISWLAKLSVKMQSPVSYLLLSLPYASMITMLVGYEILQTRPMLLPLIPILFLNKCVYHLGVVKQLKGRF